MYHDHDDMDHPQSNKTQPGIRFHQHLVSSKLLKQKQCPSNIDAKVLPTSFEPLTVVGETQIDGLGKDWAHVPILAVHTRPRYNSGAPPIELEYSLTEKYSAPRYTAYLLGTTGRSAKP